MFNRPTFGGHITLDSSCVGVFVGITRGDMVRFLGL